MINNKLMLTAVAGTAMLALTASAPALASNHGVPGNPHTVPSGKVGICHSTGSETNPYVFIIVDEHAVKAHSNHQDGRDIIGVKSADQCPKPHVAPGKGGSTTPTPAPAPQSGSNGGQVLGSSTSPSTLPDTGAGLSTLIGLPALAVAGRGYIRAKLQK